jgi:hypothetical protein
LTSSMYSYTYFAMPASAPTAFSAVIGSIIGGSLVSPVGVAIQIALESSKAGCGMLSEAGVEEEQA